MLNKCLAFALITTSAAFSQETTIQTKTENNNAISQIHIVTKCTKPRIEDDIFGKKAISEMSVIKCQGKTRYKVEVTTSGKFYNWSSSSTVVPGSEEDFHVPVNKPLVMDSKVNTSATDDEGNPTSTIFDEMEAKKEALEKCELKREALIANRVSEKANLNCDIDQVLDR